jgi:archaetidylinositol phosphate synthase
MVKLMVLNNYRHLLPRFIDGPVAFLVKHKVSPNMVSFIGFLISVAAGVCYAFPNLFLYNYVVITPTIWWYFTSVPAILFFISAYFDVLDGAVARKMNMVTKYGGFLDSTLDRISDAIIIMGLMYGKMIWPWDFNINCLIAIIALGTSMLISYTRARAEIEGVVMKGIGLMERAERVFMILGGYILEWVVFAIQRYFFPLTPKIDWVFPVFFIIFTVLCIQTFIERMSWTDKWLNNKMPEKVAKILAEQAEAKKKTEKKE